MNAADTLQVELNLYVVRVRAGMGQSHHLAQPYLLQDKILKPEWMKKNLS